MASAAGARRPTSSSLAKRHASTSENLGKVTSSAAASKKRPALANITNQRHGVGSVNAGRPESSKIVPCSTKIVSIKKGPSASTNASFSGPTLLPTASSMVAANRATSLPKSDVLIPKITAASASCNMDLTESPDKSDSCSVSMDESMSTCDSLKSPDVEYMDNNEIAAVDSIERKASNLLCISEPMEIAGNMCKRDVLAAKESGDKIVDVDDNLDDPQLCATIACDIYKHLRASEAKKRPATNFMEKVQKDINASMRAILIDWLVEVAEEYRLVPDTLYLTVNYIDRYLSGNVMDRQRLQLLGVACMMIASKYEEICAPQVEEFCYITDNTYFKEEVLQMESAVLNYLKFEMTAPTAKCFLRRLVRVAQGVNEAPLLQLECLANYIAELSLLEYSMLCFAPSLIAASSIYLARFILIPSKRPWNPTLRHYTLYQPYDLRDCVLALHGLCCNSNNSSLPAIREKYSQHKYKFVAKKYCPPSIPQEYFHNISS
ncbi:G2/Mitotic-specific cyclin A [Handroanthus impetiginosus]|uniref:G2/Mitotic-specific cyclin A n=1 Tax=Handroanthus impetiginosus TaxID=429701 RepID=A0A2G9HHP6_9LAMI|nr:G2/Mitotic-specific cyclin A [Handroanthus impetiginosus]